MAYKKKGVVRDSAFYAAIGRKGGMRTRQKMLAQNPNYYRDIGIQGSEALMNKHGGPEQAKAYFSRIRKQPQEQRDA